MIRRHAEHNNLENKVMRVQANKNMCPIQREETFDEKLSSLATLISNKKNIVVLAGAGISVSCGIPDFRSKDGLYNSLNFQELGLTCAEDLFDYETFRDDPRPFWKFAKMNRFMSLDTDIKLQPSTSHLFLAWLDQQQMLLRIYTQNIDGLEESAGVNKDKIVYAHGSFSGATCMKCKANYQNSDIASEVHLGSIPVCHRQIAKKAKISQASTVTVKTSSINFPSPERRRSSRKLSSTNTLSMSNSNRMAEEFYPPPVKPGCCGGIIKPNITFFGEKLDNSISRRIEEDCKKVDALIVMGTSLSVAPMSKLVCFLPDNIPRILINRDIVQVMKNCPEKRSAILFDACLLGNCDAVTQAIKNKLYNTCIGSGGFIEGRLVADDDINNGLWLKNQPRESILLFEGALLSAAKEKDESTHPPLHTSIVVHCNNCEHEIKDNIIFCCKTCFDYDLCSNCYSTIKLIHADGKHEFAVETQAGH